MMPAGRYYVGDLCYVMTDKEWDEFCSLTTDGLRCLHGEFNFKDGRRFATFGTRWGDGKYFDTNKLYEFSVDAGLIGCMRLNEINIKKLKLNELEELGAIIDFPYEFGTGVTDSVITIGHVVIDTDAEYEDEDEHEDEDEYY